jgi:hypothetical protein
MRTILLSFLHTVPASVFLLVVLSFRDEYYFTAYLLMAIVFWCVSLGFGVRNSQPEALLEERAGLLLFASMFFSWLIALFALGFINLTPLCIGQDNGDGINGMNECVLYTILASIIYSAVMIPMIGVVSLSGRWLIRRRSMNSNQGSPSEGDSFP